MTTPTSPMQTTCTICGQTDSSDLAGWGRNADLGWYHRACARQVRERIEVLLRDAVASPAMKNTGQRWRLESERLRYMNAETGDA